MEETWEGLQEAMRQSWAGGAFGEVLDDGEIFVGDLVGSTFQDMVVSPNRNEIFNQLYMTFISHNRHNNNLIRCYFWWQT